MPASLRINYTPCQATDAVSQQLEMVRGNKKHKGEVESGRNRVKLRERERDKGLKGEMRMENCVVGMVKERRKNAERELMIKRVVCHVPTHLVIYTFRYDSIMRNMPLQML